MAYFENPANFTNIVDAMQYANAHSGGIFGVAITFIIFGIVFFQVRNMEGTNNALMASSFISGLSAIFLMFAGLTDQVIVMIYAGLVVLSIYLSRSDIN